MFLDLSTTEVKTPEFEALPEGEYDVMISSSKSEPNKDNTGTNLNIEMLITTPEKYQGRKIFHTFAITSTNEQRKEISLGQLKTLLLLAGFEKAQLEKPTDLEYVRVNVVTKNRVYEGKTYTNVKYFKKHQTLSTQNDQTSDIPF